MLQAGIKGKSIISKGLHFGVVIFGLNWLMIHIFMTLVVEFSPHIIIRAVLDILFISMGVCVCKKLFDKSC